MLEQFFVGTGAAIVVLLAMRWYIGAEIARQIERRWQVGLSRHSAQLEALKQRRVWAEIAAKQAEERGQGHGR